MDSILKEKLLDHDWLYNQSVTQDKSSRIIAIECNCSRNTIKKYLRHHHIKVGLSGVNRDKIRAEFKNFSRQVPAIAIGRVNNKDWLYNQYITLNRSMKEIAKSLDISIDCVVIWLRKFDIWKSKDLANDCQKRGYQEVMGFDRGSIDACISRIHSHKHQFIITNKGGKIYCHSSWERQVAEILDGSPAVRALEKDALRLNYQIDGKSLIYIPDFLITLVNNDVVVIEVKAERFLYDRKTIAKLEALRNYALRHKYNYLVLTGRSKVNLEPLQLLVRDIR